MPSVTVPHQFVPNTDILASEANANFQALVNAVNGNIGADNLQNSAVTTSKLAEGAVTTPKIWDGAVTASKVAPKSINGAKWEDVPPHSVLGRNAYSSGMVGYIAASEVGVVLRRAPDGSLGFGKVTGDMLDAGAVASASLGPDSVGTGNLKNGAVTDVKLASSGLDVSRFTTGVLNVNLVPNIPASKITSGVLSPSTIPSINASKITSGTIDVAHIPNMSASKITSGQFGTARIADGAIDGAKLAGTLVGDRTFAGTVSFTSPIQLPLL